MPDIDLAAADPVARIVAWLRARPKVKIELGLAPDADARDYIGDRDLAPYPRLLVSDPPGGTMRNLRWLMAPAVQLEAIGDLDGRPGKAQLRRILLVALQEVALLPEQPAQPGEAVITNIGGDGSIGGVPKPNGQPRYLATVYPSIHPPVPASEPVGAVQAPVGVTRPAPVTAPALGRVARAQPVGRRGGVARRDTKG